MDVFSKLKKVNFIPVVSAAVLEAMHAEKYSLDGRQCSFASPNSIYSYDKCLVNPLSNFKALVIALEYIREDVILFSDSGGLQELTLGKKMQTPEQVVLWQEENVHIGFSLDSIPLKFENDNNRGIGKKLFFDSKNFVMHAEKSAENIYRANDVRSKPGFRFYAIIQGQNYQSYKQWFSIIDNKQIDGYCLKSANLHSLSMAETCLFAYHNLSKPIHFLGVENFSRSVICIYLSKYYKHPISFDGSSWSMGCRIRNYRLPFSISKGVQFLSEDVEANENVDDDLIGTLSNIDSFNFCHCPACQLVLDFNKMKDDLRFGMLLSLHNLWHTVSRSALIEKMIYNRQLLDNFVRAAVSKSSAERVIGAFDFIDLGVEKGYELAREKYKFLIQSNEDFVKQTSVLDF